MSKRKDITGMLYPEILDKREYSVSSGTTASINRQKAKAITLEDSFCTCNYEDAKQSYFDAMRKAGHEDISLSYVARKLFAHLKYQHARNIRKLVMYREMFPLPKMTGVASISKSSLNSAYRMHRLYKARWNLANKKRKEEHDKHMAERKALGQWTWNYTGVSYRGEAMSVYCPEILVNEVAQWIMHEDIPVQQMLPVLQTIYRQDSTMLKDFVGTCMNVIEDYIDEIGDTKYIIDNLERNIENNYHYPLSSMEEAYSHLVLTPHLIDTMLLHALKGGIFTSAEEITAEELYRRLNNMYQLIYTHDRFLFATLPYNKYVSFRTLAKYHHHVKRLAKFYDIMETGDITGEVSGIKPKSLQDMEDAGLDLSDMNTMYKPSQFDKQIQQQIDKELGQPHKIAYAGKTVDDIRWAQTQVIKANLSKDLTTKLKSRRYRPSDVGAIPKYMNRWATDKYIWANKRTDYGGTLAIDLSGSMSLRSDQLEAIVTALPAAKIVGYAGDERKNPQGIIEILAEKGRTVSDFDKDSFIRRNGYGNNLVDMPVIKYLSRMPKPRIIVSDMQCVALSSGYYHDEWLDNYCIEQAHKNDIIILRNVDDAIEFAKKLRTL